MVVTEEINNNIRKGHILTRKRSRKMKSLVMMNIGILLLSAGIHFFKIPNGFSTGGVSGIGTILGNITGLTPAEWIVIINMLLLIAGFICLGKDTGIKTVYCSSMFSALTWGFEYMIPIAAPVSNEAFLELVYAILLTSIGSALIFNSGASSGGTDIVALILKKYTKMNVGKALLFTDFIIAGCSFFVFNIRTGLFSMLGLFAKAFIIDSVLDNLNSCKYFIVITSKYQEIAEYIMRNIRHGVTINDAVGGYTNSQKKMLHTVCKRIEAIKLREKVMDIDPQAFVIITTSSEIIGRGFREI